MLIILYRPKLNPGQVLANDLMLEIIVPKFSVAYVFVVLEILYPLPSPKSSSATISAYVVNYITNTIFKRTMTTASRTAARCRQQNYSLTHPTINQEMQYTTVEYIYTLAFHDFYIGKGTREIKSRRENWRSYEC